MLVFNTLAPWCPWWRPCHWSIGDPGPHKGAYLPLRGIVDGAVANLASCAVVAVWEAKFKCWWGGFIALNLCCICCAHHLHLARQVFWRRPCRHPGLHVISAVPFIKVTSFFFFFFYTDCCCVRARERARVCMCATKPAGTSRHGNTHTGFTKSVGA